MNTTETVPCLCGKGVLEVEVKDFGRWRVERVLAACSSCGQGDIEASREAQPVASEAHPMSAG